MYAQVAIINNTSCRSETVNDIYDTHICFSTANLRSSACGDSGGPLVLHVESKIMQVGIISYGTAQDYSARKPGVATRISSFIDWIEKISSPMSANELD